MSIKRKLIKFSNYSLCVTLPKKLLTELGLERSDTVEIEYDAKKRSLILRPLTESVSKPNLKPNLKPSQSETLL